ncbi:MAG: adenylate/guanylate cyclase domain-containing protein, partial [Burkholderiales bacterium]
MQRRLAAILSADVEGYSRLMGDDEVATVRTLSTCRRLIANVVESRRGRVVDMPGDNILAEFGSAVDAVEAAIAMQAQLGACNAELPEHRRMAFRIGVNLGDLIVDEERIYGDGVNVAARIEALAEPGGICVSGKVYEEVRRKVDLAFEDSGEHELRNIPAPVRVYRIAPGSRVAAQKSDAQRPAAKPGIIVLPFINMSGVAEQEFFADGLSEDILTELSRFHELFVISRNTSFKYKGQAVDVRKVAKELGVQYVVEGSVRRAGNRVRVNVQLIDAESDRHIWAERYDRELEDIFAIQDEVTSTIAATLPGRVEAASRDRAARKPTEKMAAYECVLAAKVLHHRSTRTDNAEALRLIERAIELDPNYAHAHAWRACITGQQWTYNWCEDRRAAEKTVERELEIALALDDNDSDVHRILAALNLNQNNHDKATYHQQR